MRPGSWTPGRARERVAAQTLTALGVLGFVGVGVMMGFGSDVPHQIGWVIGFSSFGVYAVNFGMVWAARVGPPPQSTDGVDDADSTAAVPWGVAITAVYLVPWALFWLAARQGWLPDGVSSVHFSRVAMVCVPLGFILFIWRGNVVRRNESRSRTELAILAAYLLIGAGVATASVAVGPPSDYGLGGLCTFGVYEQFPTGQDEGTIDVPVLPLRFAMDETPATLDLARPADIANITVQWTGSSTELRIELLAPNGTSQGFWDFDNGEVVSWRQAWPAGTYTARTMGSIEADAHAVQVSVVWLYEEQVEYSGRLPEGEQCTLERLKEVGARTVVDEWSAQPWGPGA